MLRIVVSASLLASAGAMQLVTSSVRKAVPEDGKQILVEQEGEESQQVVQQEMTITEMCKSCNWDCYLKRYPGLKNKQWEAEHPQKGLEYAKMHYIKYGRASGRSCQCDADMLAAKLVEQPWDAVRLEGQLAEQTEVLAEAAAEVELIKGCDWNCYLDRYPKIRNEKWEQEKGNQDYARSHYLKFGRVAGKNCKCGPGPKNLITGASLLQLPILVEQEADESQQVVQQEMTITEMCKSCNWDCYLKRYPGLKNKQWEAEHPQKGLEYAKLHYIKYGRASGRSCQCDADMLAAKLVEQPWDAVRLEGQLAEQTEVLAEAAAEVELIKGCDWNCYLDRYPKLRNEKWEQEKGNQDYARSHYLKFGRVAGKNCKCQGGK